jgi:aminoglycoside 3-N-acetyltransferase I
LKAVFTILVPIEFVSRCWVLSRHHYDLSKMNPISKELKVKLLKKKDLVVAQQLFLLFQEVFEEDNQDIAPAPYLEKLLKRTGFISFAAIYKKQVIGGLTAYELPMYYAECSEIFIYDIAVKPRFQKKGVGKALLKAMNDYALQRNINVMFVDASEDDVHAIDFYRSTGASEEKVVMFSYGVKQM